MTKFLASIGMLLAIFGSANADGVEKCSKLLADAPGSAEAKVCLTKEAENLNHRISSLEESIDSEIHAGHSSFTLNEFRQSQDQWRKFVNSTCWLDASGAVNADTVLQICSSQYLLQRIAQLESLRKNLAGEEPTQWPMSNPQTARTEP